MSLGNVVNNYLNQVSAFTKPISDGVMQFGNNSYSYTNGDLTKPVGNTYRGLFSDWINAGNIAKEDWLRAEQSNMLEREYNAAEAQKNRDFQERMSRNAYTYAVEDMKRAGINPILQYANHSMSLPQGSNAYSSNSQSNYRGKTANTAEYLSFLTSLASIGAGLYSSGAFSKKPSFGFGK